MILEKVILLAGFTARTQAYVQALVNKGYEPEHTILFGPEKPILPGQTSEVWAPESIPWLFLPDLNIAARKTIEENNWGHSRLDCYNVNDPRVAEAIKALNPSMVIYSGYGSQIIEPALFDMGVPLLHMHSGFLPEYKGSTTIYYSWIKEQSCGVSAIFLLPGIDEGPIVLKKRFPLPPVRVDPDYIYDCAIRAETLIEVMNKYVEKNEFPQAEQQTEKGNTYYVIHPLLKHIARLSSLSSDT